MQKLINRRPILLAAVLIAVVFLASLRVASDAPVAILYTIAILFASRAPRPRVAYLFALVATGLFLAHDAIASVPEPFADAAAHGVVFIAVFWATAASVVHYRYQRDNQMGERGSRQKIEQALREADEAHANIKRALDQSAIVATTNVRGDITYVNDKFCEISGYSESELVGQNHRLVNSGLHPIEFFKDMYATIGRGQVWRGEIRNRAKDGSFYWVDTTIVPFLDTGHHPYEYIAIRYDITARKKSEAALRDQNALAQLGKLAAVVAHEVRNPLAGIRGALQMIGRRVPAGSQEHAIIGEVIGRVDTLNEIVQDLLLFARPTQPVISRVAVATVLTETLALFKQDPEAAAVALDVGETDAIISADAEQLKLVLLNLLMNAAQAMHGTGRLRIRTAATGTGHEIRIHDEGPGIPPDVREHLFEPFFTTRHRGTGLGLVTARRLMEAHGGTVRLDCPPEGGTVAIVSLADR